MPQQAAERPTPCVKSGRHLSASSRMTILCLPGGSVVFFCANIFILFRTTSIPLQSPRKQSLLVRRAWVSNRVEQTVWERAGHQMRSAPRQPRGRSAPAERAPNT